MLGVVFVSFTDFVEARFGEVVLDEILSGPLESGGAYTAVGTYSHEEMFELVGRLSARIETPAGEILRGFGEALFAKLADAYPAFIDGHATPRSFLGALERHIHVEVQKLYPDAQLPSFDYETGDQGEMILLYSSPRNLSDLCHGLLIGCFRRYGVSVELSRESLPAGSDRGDLPAEKFTLNFQESAGVGG